MKQPYFLALPLFAVVVSSFHAFAADENIAEGKPYECVVRPNYWGWKQPHHGDSGQLVDGLTVGRWDTEAGPIYSQPSSMGWTGKPPVVIFDLGESRVIDGLGLHTVLSSWGPWWPKELTVLVSDDNENFRLAAATFEPTPDQLDPPLTPKTVQIAVDRVLPEHGLGPTTHWYRTRGLRAKGRYVALIMSLPPATGTIVVDEVEIYAGDETETFIPHPSPVFSEGKGGWKSLRLYTALNRRISQDLASLRRKIEQSDKIDEAKAPLFLVLDDLEEKAARQPIPATDGFRAVYPMTRFQEEIFAHQASWWRASGLPLLHVWKTNRWDPLDPIGLPGTGNPAVRIKMAQNAVRSDVFNLSNALSEPVTVRLTLSHLPESQIDLFEVPIVDTHSFEPVASALVPLQRDEAGYRVAIHAGLTHQVWVRFSSRGVEPGQVEGLIRLSAEITKDKPWSANVPVSVAVEDVTLPEKLSLRLGGWDYPAPGQYEVTEENLDAYVAVLNEYGVNVTWIGYGLPMGTFGEDGTLITPPARDSVGTWLTSFPNALEYCAVSAFGTNKSEALVTEWARDWAAYYKERGLDEEQFSFLIRDEPTTLEELKAIYKFGRAIKRGAQGFKIFNDIHYPDPSKAPPLLHDVMREACDIQCFNVGHFLSEPKKNRAFMEEHAREGLAWWCYTGGKAHRLCDPYVAWLLRPWFCFKEGVTGANWWAFGDGNGGFSWSEYFNSGTTRSPLYLDRDSITTSKSMEAMREGAQDYELLMLLHRRDAESWILEKGVDRVLAAHTLDLWLWNTAKNRSAADAVRGEMLSLLSEGE